MKIKIEGVEYDLSTVQNALPSTLKVMATSEIEAMKNEGKASKKQIEEAESKGYSSAMTSIDSSLKALGFDKGTDEKTSDLLSRAFKTKGNDEVERLKGVLSKKEAEIKKANDQREKMLADFANQKRSGVVDSIISTYDFKDDVKETPMFKNHLDSVKKKLILSEYEFKQVGDSYHLYKEGVLEYDKNYQPQTLKGLIEPNFNGLLKEKSGGAGSKQNGDAAGAGSGGGGNGDLPKFKNPSEAYSYFKEEKGMHPNSKEFKEAYTQALDGMA